MVAVGGSHPTAFQSKLLCQQTFADHSTVWLDSPRITRTTRPLFFICSEWISLIAKEKRRHENEKIERLARQKGKLLTFQIWDSKCSSKRSSPGLKKFRSAYVMHCYASAETYVLIRAMCPLGGVSFSHWPLYDRNVFSNGVWSHGYGYCVFVLHMHTFVYPTSYQRHARFRLSPA